MIENSSPTPGEVLKKMRTDKGLSQNKLAKLAGLDQSYINSIERGKKARIGYDAAVKIAKVLGVNESVLLKPGRVIPGRTMEAVLKEAQKILSEMEIVQVPIRGCVPCSIREIRKENAGGHLTLTKGILDSGSKNGLTALRVADNSLIGDGIVEGDYLVIDPKAEMLNGKLYIVKIGEQIRATHVYSTDGKHWTDGKVELVSTEVAGQIKSDLPAIQGRVIIKFGKL